MTFTTTRHDVEGYVFDVRDSGGHHDTVYLLLHGVGLSHRSFMPLATLLSRRGRAIVLDLPGFGSTPKPREGVAVEEYARLIAVLAERLGIASCVVTGHSMGAQFALAMAVAEPGMVSHLVMIGPVTDSRRRTAAQQAMALMRDSAREPVATNAMVFTDYLRCGPRWYLREVAAMLAYPTHEQIRRLTRPLLVVRGANDPVAPESWCQRLTHLAGGGDTVTIPGHRHVVAHTAAEEVALAVTNFVARTDAAEHTSAAGS